MAPVRDLTPGSDGVDGGADEIRERHPEGTGWRADALAASRHRRLSDEIPQPQDDFDPAHAEALCAEICRQLLGDYAPGVALLPIVERRRVQALAAYTRTLFDFARQRGLEGERLAQINRWEFTLETALTDRLVGQPVFVAMRRCEADRPWPREALDAVAAAARRAVTRDEQHPWGLEDDRRLASALVGAWLGDSHADTPARATVENALALRRRVETATSPSARSAPPRTQPSAPGSPASRSPGESGPAAGEPVSARAGTPPSVVRFLRFVALTTAAIERRVAGGADMPAGSRLGLGTRLRLLLRARFAAAG
jgi:hypothetical protein